MMKTQSATMSLARELVVILLLASMAVVLGQVDHGSRKKTGKSLLKKYLEQNINRDLGKNEIGTWFYSKPVFPKKSSHNTVGKWNPMKNRVEDVDYMRSPSKPTPTDPEPTPTDLVSRQPSPPSVGATPCQTAEQWEGRASEWDHIQGINNRFNITYDGAHRRKRIMEEKHAQLPGKRIYEYIMLYDEGIQYVINHNYNTCTVENLGTWRNFTIPPNSTLEDYYEIGAPGSRFMVQEWSDRIPGRQKESWIGTFTYPGCWPMTEIFMEKDGQNRMVQSVSTRFFDLYTGIKNMSIFTPPVFCENARRPITDSEQSTTTSSEPVSPNGALNEEPRNISHIRQERPTLDQLANENMSDGGSGDEMSGEGSGVDLFVDWSGVDMSGEGSGERSVEWSGVDMSDEGSGDEMSEGSEVDLSVDWSGVDKSDEGSGERYVERSGEDTSGEGSGEVSVNDMSVNWSGVDMSGEGSGIDLSVDWSGVDMSGEGFGERSVEWSGVDMSGEGSGDEMSEGSGVDLSVEWSGVDKSDEGSGERSVEWSGEDMSGEVSGDEMSEGSEVDLSVDWSGIDKSDGGSGERSVEWSGVDMSGEGSGEVSVNDMSFNWSGVDMSGEGSGEESGGGSGSREGY